MKKFRLPFLNEEKYQKYKAFIPEKKSDLYFLIIMAILLSVLLMFIFAQFLLGLILGLVIGIPLGAIVYEYIKQNHVTDKLNDKKILKTKKDDVVAAQTKDSFDVNSAEESEQANNEKTD